MKKTIKKDLRDKPWAKLELEIQKNAGKKDKKFILAGVWKNFLRIQNGLKVYSVDGDWIRKNLSITFGHGGHGYVHEFIPLKEIWVSAKHSANCECRNVKKNRQMSESFFNSTVLHEIEELKEMKKGKIYWRAHQIALEEEIKAGMLKDPYAEVK